MIQIFDEPCSVKEQEKANVAVMVAAYRSSGSVSAHFVETYLH